MKFFPIPLFVVFGLMLSACGNLPAEGPGMSEIGAVHNDANTAGFVLVDINAEVANLLHGKRPPTMSDRFGKGRPFRSGRIGIGDVLTIQIWEADPGGLFSSTGAVNRGAIPPSTVDNNGRIIVPFAGSIRAAGRSTAQLSRIIAKKLSSKTVEPQVHVTISKNVSNTVSITGVVRNPRLIPLGNEGFDLLEFVASAGGSRHPSYETRISLTRRGKIGHAYLSHLVATPRDNIYLRPGDKVHAEKMPQSFTAFGAVTRSGKVDFKAASLTVLEGIARVRGLSDARADARGVFVLRFEPAKFAEQLTKTPLRDGRRTIPVIYRFNLRDPNQYFFAQTVHLENKDVIYVANAPTVELNKFLVIVGRGVSIAENIKDAVTP